MTTQHTPGPWLARARKWKQGMIVVRQTDNDNHILVAQIAETSTKIDEPERAPFDAALISAAPELLSALVMFLDEYANGLKGTDPERNKRPEVIAARAAIAKAKGTR